MVGWELMIWSWGWLSYELLFWVIGEKGAEKEGPIIFTDVSCVLLALVHSFRCFNLSNFSKLYSYRLLYCRIFSAYVTGPSPLELKRVGLCVLFVVLVFGDGALALFNISLVLSTLFLSFLGGDRRGPELQSLPSLVREREVTSFSTIPAGWFSASHNDRHFLDVYTRQLQNGDEDDLALPQNSISLLGCQRKYWVSPQIEQDKRASVPLKRRGTSNTDKFFLTCPNA